VVQIQGQNTEYVAKTTPKADVGDDMWIIHGALGLWLARPYVRAGEYSLITAAYIFENLESSIKV
jgi:hypothetical protein